jgi:hypothetical protein
MVAAGEGVLAVAPGAAHRTAGQTHKSAWAAGVRGFALDRMKDFGDAEHSKILDSGNWIVDAVFGRASEFE